MLNINDFLNLINELDIAVKDTESINLGNAMGRILATDIVCRYSIPKFDNSAMDGYAIRAGYDVYNIVENTFAGDDRTINISNNDACKINTGSRIPNGADCVVQQELVNVIDNTFILDTKIEKGLNIKFKGEEFKEGDILLHKGVKIDAKSIALLASQGINIIEVYKVAKLIIFGSGDEIIPLDIFGCQDSTINDNQLFDINSIFLQSIFKDFDCEYGGVIKDDKDALLHTIKNVIGKYDIIITSGGASVGSRDYIYDVLKEIGADVIVNGVNIKPGKPVKLSLVDNTFILSLPGNPIASFIMSMLVIPNIATRLSGGNSCYLSYNVAVNKTYFKLKPNSCNVILGNFISGEFFIFNDGKYQNSSFLPLVSSNAFVIFDQKQTEILPGEKIKVIVYDFTFLDTMPNIVNEYCMF